MQLYDGGNQITCGNGLKGVGVLIQMFRVEAQQIALYNHSEDEQKDEAFDDFAVNGSFVRIVFKLGERERHGGSCHEEEKRHYQIPETEPLPYFMIELEKNTVQPWEVELMCQCPQYRLRRPTGKGRNRAGCPVRPGGEKELMKAFS